MSDCIYRQQALDAIRNIKAIIGTFDDEILLIDKAQAQTELMMLPYAEPQIIRCKDCRWWTKHDTTLQGKCKLHNLNPMPEWYCASGKVGE